MEQMDCRWGRSSIDDLMLGEAHLHIDDPALVISQRRGEQRKVKGLGEVGAEFLASRRHMALDVDLDAPWNALADDRPHKD